MGINNGNERQVSMFIPLSSSHNELSHGIHRITMNGHCLFGLEDNPINMNIGTRDCVKEKMNI